MADEKHKARGRIKDAIASTAPMIAEALGGPLAGAAVSALSRAIFGAAGASEEAIDKALKSLSADQAAALVQAEMDFQATLAKATVEETRIHASDRENARARHRSMRDWTPTALGALIVIGFFIVLGAMVTQHLPPGSETEFSIMLGALATMTAAVVNYFFGSSLGSKEKTQLMSFGRRPAGEE